MNETENWTRGSPSYKSLVSPQPAFYITDFVRSAHWLYSPTWIDFRMSKALKFNQCFLLDIFCFFRLGHPPSFQSGVFPTADIITWRGKQSFPLQPPTHLKCSFLGLRLGVKTIRATHTQARTIITVLDFLLAQNTPPVALWACRLRFFAPRDFARPEIR